MKPVFGKAPNKILLLLLLAAGVGVSACSSNPDKDKAERRERPVNPFKNGGALDPAAKTQLSERDLKLEAGALYKEARKSLESGDYAEANLRYDSLVQRYPFTEYATQSELERIYSLHKEFKPDEALSAADRFLREHPRFPAADYVQYMKGVINSERDAGLLDSLSLAQSIPVIDPTQGDIGNLRRAFDEFSLLVQKYPGSRYNADARARMADLRNRLAAHDMHVVRFYMERGAYLAASKRAEQVIALYPGAPVTLDALNMLRISYQKLGLHQQEEDANTLYLEQARKPPQPVGGIASPAASLAPAPAQAGAASAAPPAAEVASKPAPTGVAGFFAKLAGLFSFADRSEAAPLELVIPTGSASATPAPAADGTQPATATAVATPAAAADAKPPEKKTKFTVEINTGDEPEPAAQPKPATADSGK